MSNIVKTKNKSSVDIELNVKPKYMQRSEKEFNDVIDRIKNLIAIIEQHEYSVNRDRVVLCSGYINLQIKPIFH